MPFRVPVGCDKLFGGMFFWKWFTSSGCGISLQLLDFLLTSNMKIKRLSSYLCYAKNLMQEVLRSFMLEFGVGIQSSSSHKYLWRRKAKVDPTVLCLNHPIPLHAVNANESLVADNSISLDSCWTMYPSCKLNESEWIHNTVTSLE